MHPSLSFWGLGTQKFFFSGRSPAPPPQPTPLDAYGASTLLTEILNTPLLLPRLQCGNQSSLLCYTDNHNTNAVDKRLTHGLRYLFARLVGVANAVHGFIASGGGCKAWRRGDVWGPLYGCRLAGRLDGCGRRSHGRTVVGHLIAHCAPLPIDLHRVVVVVVTTVDKISTATM